MLSSCQESLQHHGEKDDIRNKCLEKTMLPGTSYLILRTIGTGQMRHVQKASLPKTCMNIKTSKCGRYFQTNSRRILDSYVSHWRSVLVAGIEVDYEDSEQSTGEGAVSRSCTPEARVIVHGLLLAYIRIITKF